MDAAAEVEKVARRAKLFGQLLALRRASAQHLFNLGGNAAQLFDQLHRLRSIERPRNWPSLSASRNSAVSCEVNAFVEATPISGPA